MSSEQFKEKDEEKIQKLVEGSEENEEAQLEQVAQTVGKHYEILSLIGKGGMSAVYKARHNLLDKLVAVKLILPKLVNDEKTLQRFKQEAEASISLQHPNICAVKEYGAGEKGHPYLVMDYVEGSSLDAVLTSEGKLTPETALKVLYKIADGLHHAHLKGVIHRDLKPANIIILKDKSTEPFDLRIVDFGIAKLVREDDAGPNLTKTGEIFGTPNYMSPEQCLGKTVDTRSDIYSLGCILFHMVSGQAPFHSNSTLETLMSQVNERVPKLPLIPPGINHIIAKCMSKNSNQRYRDAAELKADISCLLEGHDLVSSIPGRTGKFKLLAIVTLLIGLITIPFLQTIPSSNKAEERVEPIKVDNSSTPEQPDVWLQTTNQLQEPAPGPPSRFSFAPQNEVKKTRISSNVIPKGKYPQPRIVKQPGNEFESMKSKIDQATKERKPTTKIASMYEELGRKADKMNMPAEEADAYSKAAAFSNYNGKSNQYRKNLKLLAQAELKASRYGEAIRHFEELLMTQGNKYANKPELIDDWQSLGNAYYEAGQYANARRSLEQVFKLSKKHPGKFLGSVARAHMIYGKSESKLGNKSSARNHLNQSLMIGNKAGLDKGSLEEIKTALNNM